MGSEFCSTPLSGFSHLPLNITVISYVCNVWLQALQIKMEPCIWLWIPTTLKCKVQLCRTLCVICQECWLVCMLFISTQKLHICNTILNTITSLFCRLLAINHLTVSNVLMLNQDLAFIFFIFINFVEYSWYLVLIRHLLLFLTDVNQSEGQHLRPITLLWWL